ncbi:MAG: fasciclin domain-containing protein [Gammaproteobacteria bacterium]
MPKLMNFTATAATLVAALTMSVALPAAAKGPKGPVPGKPGEANIVEIAQAVNAESGEFSYLLAAATCDYFDGAVVDLLTGKKRLTLFAPTDAAFQALQETLGVATPAPEITCDAFAATPEVLFDVLAYHVTEGRRFSNSVFNRNATKPVKMLNGQFVITNPELTLTDIAGQDVGIVLDEEDQPVANINASNGVIHVIDTVLLPFTLPED